MRSRTNLQKKRYETKINKAIHAHKMGATYRDAASKHGVDHTTLFRRVNTPYLKLGRRRALQKHEEERLVQFLLKHAKRGIPLTMTHLKEAIRIMVSTMSPARRILLPFRNNEPGRAFLRAFRKRHQDMLSFSKPLRQESKRMAAMNADVLTAHFAKLTKLFEEYSFDASRIFNLDECGTTPEKYMNGNLACRRFLPRRGSQDYRVNDFAYLHRITMMPVISAEGNCGPPLFVFKGTRLPFRSVLQAGSIVEETPACRLPYGSTLALRAENGGVDSLNFLNWAEDFVKYIKPLTRYGRKVLLIYDAYRAHISLEVLEVLHRNSVVVYALPAHTSVKSQPLDVVPFSVFKNQLNLILSNMATVQEGNGLDLFDICGILCEAYKRTFIPTNITASFRRAGIWPLDERKLLSEEIPENASTDAHLLSVEELDALFKERREEYRKTILGSDAVVGTSGFIDTTNGCVMTSDTALQLVREKKERDHQKFLADVEKERQKEQKELKRRLLVIHVRRLMRRGLLGKIS